MKNCPHCGKNMAMPASDTPDEGDDLGPDKTKAELLAELIEHMAGSSVERLKKRKAPPMKESDESEG